MKWQRVSLWWGIGTESLEDGRRVAPGAGSNRVFRIARGAGVRRRHLVRKDGVRYFWAGVLQAAGRRPRGKMNYSQRDA